MSDENKALLRRLFERGMNDNDDSVIEEVVGKVSGVAGLR